ncbi:type II toxin-antitoxin system tRNA(fMet)-specific endonuclease VapC [Pirellulaceae bacterium SH449]
MKFLLDTNICIFVIKQKPAEVVKRFTQYSAEELGISTITLAELRYGADKSSHPSKNHTALDMFLSPLAILDFDPQCSEIYGIVRSDLERRGQPIGPLDTMIAAHALRLRIPLVTNNTKEFSRVPGLPIEDWTV